MYDVANSVALGPRQHTRLPARLGPVVRVVVRDQRSQFRHRQIALHRLAQRSEEALGPERPRRATPPTGPGQ